MKEGTLSLYSLLLQHYFSINNVQFIKKGSLLFQEGDPVSNIYLLLEGTLSVGRIHENGKEFIMKILHEEDLLLEYLLFKQSPKYYHFARTITDCELLIIDRADFEDFALHDHKMLASLTAWLSTGYLKANIKCQDLIMHGKKGSLYSILIRLCHSFGKRTANGILIDFPLTHQELANLTFGTREVIQRAMKELRDGGIISISSQKITVKDLAFLKKAVDCQNCPIEICGLN
ncbi:MULTISPECIES: Crp/Fnr family transcriptional regulator [unclassified Niallia]|uniref:Crp/Fnr family transcriptional regulator n=1 Tax=Niallia TaxID=2837506 RepID=UPI001EDA92B3|nr:MULTISPECIES: Crp/Fnr family transcriptional regulator [unclassified Niallia]MCM3030142.1 Crp/Fnr family transcriptional regulator [Niallia sp. MER 6]MDL0436591.1 Crp/Fnr family transcriptional regulator [Niallia sp. SS-2023]UPO86579.1 Crp/Fnr family transcriptional regulator [Niallia sp. Man26]